MARPKKTAAVATEPAQEPAQQTQITIDRAEFVRTRDALVTSCMKLNGALTETITAYINHTNSVLSGQESLDTGKLDILGQLGLIGSHSEATLKTEPEPEGKQKRKYTVKPMDPNAPKRPLTAYFLFLQSVRPDITAELGKEQKRGDVAAEATRRWNELPEEQKQEWKDRYQASKDVYTEELKEYKAKGDVAAIEAPDAQEDEEEDVHADEEEAASVAGAAVEAKAGADSDASSTTSDSSSDSSDSEDEVPAKAPTPPPAKTGRGRKAKAVGAHSSPVAPTPASKSKANGSFIIVNGEAKESSPTLKRKQDPSAKSDSPEQPKKKRGRPAKVKPAAEEVATPVAETPKQAQSVPASVKKDKKEKKKGRKSLGADA